MNKRERLFKKIDDLDHVIHILEATANVHYSPNDNMWNVLLKARNKVSKPIEDEKKMLYKEIEELDKQKGEVPMNKGEQSIVDAGGAGLTLCPKCKHHSVDENGWCYNGCNIKEE